MKAKAFTTTLAILLLGVAPVRGAQSAIEKITLGPEQLGVVKTAPGITTRVSFPDPVQEVVCGDLYDPGTGKGTFVIQRSGTPEKPGNDIFLKPVAAKGMSNMFVKTADGRNTYNFDLKIVPADQAHRVVHVADATPSGQPRQTGDAQPQNDGSRGGPDKTAEEVERIKANAEQQGRTRADEIIRNARQQADRVIGEAQTKALELERQAAQRADGEIERRFMQAMILGIREIKAENPRATARAINIMIDPPRALIFNGKGYVRYVINNTGKQDFVYKSIVLEVGAGTNNRVVATEINQSKAENTLAPGESITGVMVFDPKEVAETDKLMLFVRGEGDTVILRLTLQQP